MSDTLFALWIAVSAALLLLFLYAVVVNLRNQQSRPVALDELIPSLQPVDLESFSRLIQEQGSHLHMGDKDLNRLRLERTSEMIELLRRMAHNAAMLQRLGYGHLNSGNELISDLAQQMVDAGVHVRLYTFIGLATLRLSRALHLSSLEIVPAARVAELREMMSGSLLPAYESLKEKAGNLTCLKFSGLSEALSANL